MISALSVEFFPVVKAFWCIARIARVLSSRAPAREPLGAEVAVGPLDGGRAVRRQLLEHRLGVLRRGVVGVEEDGDPDGTGVGVHDPTLGAGHSRDGQASAAGRRTGWRASPPGQRARPSSTASPSRHHRSSATGSGSAGAVVGAVGSLTRRSRMVDAPPAAAGRTAPARVARPRPAGSGARRGPRPGRLASAPAAAAPRPGPTRRAAPPGPPAGRRRPR